MATQYIENVATQEPHAFGDPTQTVVRKLSLSDLSAALRLGWDDFQAMPSHAILLCVIYPVLGLVLFELSRRRESGEEAAAWHAIYVLRAPSFGAMVELGILLFVLFGIWIATADAIYIAIFGHTPAASIPDFATRILTTPEGWTLIVVGCGVGFLFAVVALCVSVVAFPLMLDRHATAIDAIRTSLRAVMKNPIPMAAWGLIVAVLLAVGSLP